MHFRRILPVCLKLELELTDNSPEPLASERKEFRAVKIGLLRTGGIVGRTWFLETLLPSGRKHRAPGYERTCGSFFSGRYVSERGSCPKIFGSRTALSLR